MNDTTIIVLVFIFGAFCLGMLFIACTRWWFWRQYDRRLEERRKLISKNRCGND